MTGHLCARCGADLDRQRQCLRELAAHHRLGAFINAADELVKATGGDALPAEVFDACIAIRGMLEGLGLTDTHDPLTAGCWRDEP